jgi:hypothetical protein
MLLAPTGSRAARDEQRPSEFKAADDEGQADAAPPGAPALPSDDRDDPEARPRYIPGHTGLGTAHLVTSTTVAVFVVTVYAVVLVANLTHNSGHAQVATGLAQLAVAMREVVSVARPVNQTQHCDHKDDRDQACSAYGTQSAREWIDYLTLVLGGTHNVPHDRRRIVAHATAHAERNTSMGTECATLNGLLSPPTGHDVNTTCSSLTRTSDKKDRMVHVRHRSLRLPSALVLYALSVTLSGYRQVPGQRGRDFAIRAAARQCVSVSIVELFGYTDRDQEAILSTASAPSQIKLDDEDGEEWNEPFFSVPDARSSVSVYLHEIAIGPRHAQRAAETVTRWRSHGQETNGASVGYALIKDYTGSDRRLLRYTVPRGGTAIVLALDNDTDIVSHGIVRV